MKPSRPSGIASRAFAPGSVPEEPTVEQSTPKVTFEEELANRALPPGKSAPRKSGVRSAHSNKGVDGVREDTAGRSTGEPKNVSEKEPTALAVDAVSAATAPPTLVEKTDSPETPAESSAVSATDSEGEAAAMNVGVPPTNPEAITAERVPLQTLTPFFSATSPRQGAPSIRHKTDGLRTAIPDQNTVESADSASNGINSAQSASQVKHAAKTGQIEQPLPGETIGDGAMRPATGSELPRLAAQSYASAAHLSVIDATDAIAGPAGTPARETPEVTSTNSAAMRAIAVETAISRAVVQVRHEHLDTMAVLVKPDTQTQIRLTIVRDGEAIYVDAKLDRGDFAVLSGHWPELQRDLRDQGIWLGNIQGNATRSDQQGGRSDDHARAFGENLQEQQGRPFRDQQIASEAQPANTTKTQTNQPVRMRAMHNRAFDSWA